MAPLFDYQVLRNTVSCTGDMDTAQQYTMICGYLDDLIASAGLNYNEDCKVACNTATKVAIYCKIAGRLNKSKRKNSRPKHYDRDPSAMFVTKKICTNNIRSFFRQHPNYKLLVNVSPNQQYQAVMIIRSATFSGDYQFTVSNCDHDMTGITDVLDIFRELKPHDKEIRCITRAADLDNRGYCLAYTWCYVYVQYIHRCGRLVRKANLVFV